MTWISRYYMGSTSPLKTTEIVRMGSVIEAEYSSGVEAEYTPEGLDAELDAIYPEAEILHELESELQTTNINAET